MAAVIYDAYLAKFGKTQDGTWNKPVYMTAYNGSNLSPDDPNYDPNLTGQSSQYYPLVGWGALKDTDQFNNQLYGKAKEVYNLGLMRSEKGIEERKDGLRRRNGAKNRSVTRAKAAKELYFLYNLIQDKDTENQTIPGEKMDGIYKSRTIGNSESGFAFISERFNRSEYTAGITNNSSRRPSRETCRQIRRGL